MPGTLELARHDRHGERRLALQIRDGAPGIVDREVRTPIVQRTSQADERDTGSGGGPPPAPPAAPADAPHETSHSDEEGNPLAPPATAARPEPHAQSAEEPERTEGVEEIIVTVDRRENPRPCPNSPASYDLRRYKAMVNVPSGETLALRLAGYAAVRDSFYTNAGDLHDIVPAETEDLYSVRTQLKWQPGERLSAVVGYDVTNEGGTGYGVEYDLAERNLAYATVSTGHKAGGYNDTIYARQTDATGAPQQLLFDSSYRPESVIAFEVGSKNLFFERRLMLNAAAFYYRYRDQVFQQIVEISPDPDPTDTQDQASKTSLRQNATSSNIVGLDLDAVGRLPAGLKAEAHLLLMNARFGQGTIVNDGRIGWDVSEYPVDIGGNWLPRASPYTVNYALSQLIGTEVGQFTWLIQGQTRAQHFMSVFNGDGTELPQAVVDPIKQREIEQTQAYQSLLESTARLTDKVPTYTRFDVSAGWSHPEGRLSLDAFVNNLLNTTYATTIISTPGLNLRFFNPPRTVGLRMRLEW